jgi:hypothetical protein
MSMTQSLLKLTDAYCEAVGRSRSRLATILFNDGKKLDLIAGGADLTTGSYERAMHWLDENWPEGTPWPKGVDRPSLKAVRDDMRAIERSGKAA